MTIYRYEMTIPVKVVSALHSGGVDKAPEREYVDEDGRTAQPNEFVRNGLGEAVLPGRSIKGAVRAAFEEHAVALGFADPGGRVDEPALKSLWGGELRRNVGASKQQRGLGADADLPLRASALTFHHAVVWTDGALPHRMSTAIDRAWGSAADGALFSYEYLPVDTTFEIRISAEARDGDDASPTTPPRNEADAPSTDNAQSKTGGDNSVKPAGPEQVEKALRAIVTLFKDGVISLGGRTGSGWGRVSLDEDKEATGTRRIVGVCSSTGADSSKSEDNAGTTTPHSRVLSSLIGSGTPSNEVKSTPAGSRADFTRPLDLSSGLYRPVSVEIEWTSPSGVFVALPREKKDKEKRKKERAAAEQGNTIPAVPMRNWRKGQLPDEQGDKYAEALRDRRNKYDSSSLLLPGSSIRGALRSRCSRIARTVMANIEDIPDPVPVIEEDGVTSKGIHRQIELEPNLVRYMFGTSQFRGAIRVHDCETSKIGEPIQITHNAIDRWTGGVADGALFSELLYPNAEWKAIRIEIDPERLKRNVRIDSPDTMIDDAEALGRARASWCLLCLALAELCAGTLPLGGKTTRGLGEVTVSSLRIQNCNRRNPDDSEKRVVVDEPTGDLRGAEDILKYLRGEATTEPATRLDERGYNEWANALYPKRKNSDSSKTGTGSVEQ